MYLVISSCKEGSIKSRQRPRKPRMRALSSSPFSATRVPMYQMYRIRALDFENRARTFNTKYAMRIRAVERYTPLYPLAIKMRIANASHGAINRRSSRSNRRRRDASDSEGTGFIDGRLILTLDRSTFSSLFPPNVNETGRSIKGWSQLAVRSV